MQRRRHADEHQVTLGDRLDRRAEGEPSRRERRSSQAFVDTGDDHPALGELGHPAGVDVDPRDVESGLGGHAGERHADVSLPDDDDPGGAVEDATTKIRG